MRPRPRGEARRLEQWAAARRRAACRLHPDRGGDPDEFVRALAEIDAARVRAEQRIEPLRHSWLRALRSRHALRRRVLTAVNRVRSALPRSAPGARRFSQL